MGGEERTEVVLITGTKSKKIEEKHSSEVIIYRKLLDTSGTNWSEEYPGSNYKAILMNVGYPYLVSTYYIDVYRCIEMLHISPKYI